MGVARLWHYVGTKFSFSEKSRIEYFGINMDYFTFVQKLPLIYAHEATESKRPGLYRRADD